MKRRNFLRTSLLGGSVATLLPQLGLAAAGTAQQKKTKQEYYELREYSFTNNDQQKLTEAYFQQAAIPAYNRLGSKAIGVFREQEAEGQPMLYVLIPYASMEAFGKVQEGIAKDAIYQKAAESYLKASAKAPAYERIQSSLMKSFTHLPSLVVPQKKDRIFELRRYEGHSEDAVRRKVHMFNEGGEIEIFNRVGLTPVFFGEAMLGHFLPNLTYMITFDDMAEHDKNWKAFGADPEWNRIKDLPEYADTVSRITRTYLSPTEFSQI